MTTLNARNLSLDDIHRLFGFHKQYNGSFTPLLSLEPLTEFEQQELVQIRNDFERYLTAGKVSEGQVKLLTVAPLLRLAGFYRYPIQITLEENIADINITDEDTIITGRFDILAVNKTPQTTANVSFWVLVIEAKNSQVEAFTGLPQLLTYAYKSLEHQTSVWGLTTNGLRYQWVYIQRGNPPTYLLMPELNLIDSERLIQLLQVLKAICKVIG
ncbi:restriction endonuclease subunit R [Coleofasciculus sp. H7-2]|uniref:restriction endonuclease subunit R n=1 Tax=Coleofasciculus sp. H7-2 TaxID=3351545 RepID=UPI003672181E